MPDVTSYWVAFQTSKKLWGSAILALLFFIAGFQVGKITSPYYSSSPIIFKEIEQASSDELLNLKQEGIQQRVAGEKSYPSPSVGVGASPQQGRAGEVDQKWVASINSDLYHHPDCPSVSRIKEENKVFFASEDEAAAAGYSPSKCTQEKQ